MRDWRFLILLGVAFRHRSANAVFDALNEIRCGQSETVCQTKDKVEGWPVNSAFQEADLVHMAVA